ncbi:LuxR C-terminal-related transcriptional regulator [Streptomyces sp. NPDC046712]|uniref:ATP-binding protein n=1 Tax=Streptomyces sp. NPDC046712 TaxID=3154802 RepID=UPI0033E341AA
MSEARVVTLTGPGGVGKTHLALRVAHGLRRSFRDGVWIVELAELTDASLLAATVAERLGLRDQSFRDPVDTVTEHLANREILLVIDNCEHLVDDVAMFTSTLIRACPRVRVLATSRQSLGVYGEAVLPVPPLPAPDPDRSLDPEALARYDSIRLFIERARAVQPSFDITADNQAVLARLCRDLDGIPLAIELSAARLRALSLDQIETRLTERFRLLTLGPRTAPGRQRTLRALIDWSHDLCSGPEQRVWARASVFAGSFDLAAVEHVAGGDGVPAERIPELVHSLVDKSVLQREDHAGTVRYRMLATMREYGRERLAASGEEAAVRLRHRDWYRDLIERLEAEWVGPDQAMWLRRLGDEHADVRAAFDFCLTLPDEGIVALRMAGTVINEFWTVRGLAAEGRYWLDRALTACPQPSPERAMALSLKGMYAILRGDFDAGLPVLDEAAQMDERAGGAAGPFLALIRGLAAQFRGDLSSAESLTREALGGFRPGQKAYELFALNTLGVTLAMAGRREEGRGWLDESLARSERFGELYYRSWALWAVSFIEADHDVARAESACREALGIHARLDNRAGSAFVLEALAWVYAHTDRPTRAATLFGAAAATWHDIGEYSDLYIPALAVHARLVDAVRSVIGDAEYESAFRRGSRLGTEEAIAFALEEPELHGASGAATTEASEEAAVEATATTALTRREEQIVDLLAEGLSNKDIAARLVISRRTAETHVARILDKLGLASRAQVAAWRANRPATR